MKRGSQSSAEVSYPDEDCQGRWRDVEHSGTVVPFRVMVILSRGPEREEENVPAGEHDGFTLNPLDETM